MALQERPSAKEPIPQHGRGILSEDETEEAPDKGPMRQTKDWLCVNAPIICNVKPIQAATSFATQAAINRFVSLKLPLVAIRHGRRL